jgi:hypothetical protein
VAVHATAVDITAHAGLADAYRRFAAEM